ncbi:type II secretion system protein M [Heliobacterium chlorum]|uniref:Type II secretion system protein M n=1 Tax=Heliobacterium chlorum TaxID=2698 RepID=A0ABR7T2C4_HELCL|nr:type II secretion system protein GspM [Heliobacterium chlorum]MBC9784923.1 type II secretion system protein M [Heliobacterium chlorum]
MVEVISWWQNRTAREKSLFKVMMTLLLSAFLYMQVLEPRWGRYQKLSHQLEAAQSQFRELQQQGEVLAEQRRNQEERSIEWNKRISQLPADSQHGGLVSKFGEAALNNEVRIFRITPDKRAEPEKGQQKNVPIDEGQSKNLLPVNEANAGETNGNDGSIRERQYLIVVEGTYGGIMGFLQEIEQKNRSLSLRSCLIKKEEGDYRVTGVGTKNERSQADRHDDRLENIIQEAIPNKEKDEPQPEQEPKPDELKGERLVAAIEIAYYTYRNGQANPMVKAPVDPTDGEAPKQSRRNPFTSI